MDRETFAAEAAEMRLGALRRRVVDNPFTILPFLALPVIPRLKVTDRGLFGADRFEFIPLNRA